MASFPTRETRLPSPLCCVLTAPGLLLPWLGTHAPWEAPCPGRRRLGGGVSGDREDRAWCRGEGRDPVGWLFSRATSLVAQLVKNPPAGRETPVQFLGWDDPLEKG